MGDGWSIRQTSTKIRLLSFSLSFNPSLSIKEEKGRKSVTMQMLKNKGLCSFSFLFLFALFKATTCDAQGTNFSRYYCNAGDNANNPSAFLINFNASHSDLRANLSTTTSFRFATAIRVRSSEPVYAIFHCRGYLSRTNCLACLDSVFTIANQNCYTKYRATVFTDGCYLRYAAVNVFSEILNPGQSGFCDDQTAAEGQSGFDTAATQALTDLRGEVLRRNGQFVAGKKVVGGGGGDVYAAGECMPILGAADCENCLQSAIRNVQGCLPGAGGRAVESACFMRFSGREFFNNSLAMDLDQIPVGGKSSSKNVIIIGATAGLAALSIFLLLVFFFCSRSKDTEWAFTGNIEGHTELQGPVSFTYDDLKSATRNFSNENKLGQGGFSSVYKGILRNGKIVAVKKLSISETTQARTDFEDEVILISNIHHRNLLSLLGCCRKGPNLLLVYEFMEKGSLDRYIFGEKRVALDWKRMFNIILGTARGLAYLHEEFNHCIIHRDIKPGNILLDDEFQPKIGDFGLARQFPEDKSHIKTRLAGTLGYTAPEYVLNGKLSEKVDAYSFGVVVLEILSGKRCSEVSVECENSYLIDWAWGLYESGSLMDLVDKSLDTSEVGDEQVKRVIEIGLMCTQSASKRPAMSDVAAMLQIKDQSRFELTRPTFITNAGNRNSSENSSHSHSSATNATMLVSHFTGR